MFIIRANSWERLLSAIPPRPMLSINLYDRLSWLHHCSVPNVHTSRAFSPSEWGPDPQCQAAQVAQWTWYGQCLAAWHCSSVWSLPCHSTADTGDLALSMAKSHWHGALHSTHKNCTRGHWFWKQGGGKRVLVAAPWTSSRWFKCALSGAMLLLQAIFISSYYSPQIWNDPKRGLVFHFLQFDY